MTSDEPLLSVNELDAYYGETRVLERVSFVVRRGETVSLLGSNGAGKTTTLRSVTGLLPPRSGKITFGSMAVSGLPANRIASLGISLVPEGRGLFTGMTVRENLEIGAFTKRARASLQSTLEEVYSLFPVLKEREGQLSGSLSGGEQQMLAIGRALMSKPELLMLDEPSLGLAPIVIEKLFQTLRHLKETKMTIVLVEQNLEAALDVADRAYLLENGKLVLEGTSAEVRNSELVRQSYLGL